MAEKKRVSILRRVAAGNGTGEGCALVVPPAFGTKYPNLAEYLSALAFPDGSERETSTLTLLLEDGYLKVCLNDRANQRGVWRTGATLEECLGSLDAAVGAEGVAWRKWSTGFRGRDPRK